MRAVVRKRWKTQFEEIIKTNVGKTGRHKSAFLPAGQGVRGRVQRYYPCGKSASKVLGFTGGDNRGDITSVCMMHAKNYLKEVEQQDLHHVRHAKVEIERNLQGPDKRADCGQACINLDVQYANTRGAAENLPVTAAEK